jgi:hypothetical protein
MILLLGVAGCRTSGGVAQANGGTVDPQQRDALFYVQYCDRTGAVREALRDSKLPKWYYLRPGDPADDDGPWRTVTAEELAAVGIDLHELRRLTAQPPHNPPMQRADTAPPAR